MNGRGRMHTRIETRVREAVEERVFPGCVVGIIRANGSRHILPFGNLTYEPDSAKVTADTIYDLASITKSIPTASLALSFIAEGRMGLADKVVEHLPELRNDRGATIEDLLRYRVQGTTLSTLKEKTPEEILEYVFAHGFDAPPSVEAHYTNLPALLLGLIVERVGGVMTPKDFKEYRDAGADVVMTATGAMWNPYLAKEIKEAYPDA